LEAHSSPQTSHYKAGSTYRKFSLDRNWTDRKSNWACTCVSNASSEWKIFCSVLF